MFQIIGRFYQTNTFAASAGTGFNQQRITDTSPFSLGLSDSRYEITAGYYGHPCVAHHTTSSILIPHFGNDIARGTNKDNTMLLAQTGKIRIFGKKTIPWVNGLGAGEQCRTDDILLIQIAFPGGSRTNANTLIGQGRMDGFRISAGVNRHRRDSHIFTGTNDPHCDFATVCN